jgi:hypothetical protein
LIIYNLVPRAFFENAAKGKGPGNEVGSFTPAMALVKENER